MPSTATTNGHNSSPHARRQQLAELHSFLRSVDNLRPDEALDEIAKLFELWARFRSFEGTLPEARLTLSERATDGALERLVPILADIEPGHGADLFQELADVGVRAGMGQYFTPSPVAEAMARYLEPRTGETWLDPFCGSGLLLGALTNHCAGDLRLFGIDRDPRVLNLARVECMLHHPTSEIQLLNANALQDTAGLLSDVGAPVDGVDGVVANPPFGAEVHDTDTDGYASFTLANGKRTPLEVLGTEQCVRMLRPGGRMGIVLPQSVLSNRSQSPVRLFLLENCTIDGVLSLPGETFQPFKGVSKASVLFLTKRSARPGSAVRLGVSRSVGWDATGKPSSAADTSEVVDLMKSGAQQPRRVATIEQTAELERNLSAEWLLRPHVEGRPLGELCTAIFTGRTPGRAAYAGAETDESTYRVLKVGDLKNHGIDWSVGERSLARFKTPPNPDRLLQLGDLATTAAAHHPRYIAAKVDYVDCFQPGFEQRTLPVAEVLVMRPNPAQVDPLVLLLWLRSAQGRDALQSCVTGQTAHLSAADVADVIVPNSVFKSDLTAAVAGLHQSLQLLRQSEAAAVEAVSYFDQTQG